MIAIIEFSCIQLDPKDRPFGKAVQIGEPKTSTLFPSRMTLEKGICAKHNRVFKLLQELRGHRALGISPGYYWVTDIS